MKKRLTALLAALLMLAAAVPGQGDGIMIPELHINPKEVPDNEALRMVRDMKAGWNLGNTFDAADCGWLEDPMDYESGWCGIKTSRKLIRAVKEAGFRTLRMPVSWHNHLSEDWTIDAAWLDRVYEVASWALEEDMYVIVNIHHDCTRAYYYPNSAHAENSEKYVRTIWTQVAAKFSDAGSRLIFEGINEPRLSGDAKREWYWNAGDPVCADAMAQIVRLNQVFVDTVRASGGNNADRYLMVPAYDANPDYACNPAFTLPEDPAENRIIVSAHAYTPYSFALEQPGTDSFSLEGNQKSEISGFMDRLYRTFVSKGIPVVIGEFGAMEKNGNLQARVDWTAQYVAVARSRGITCCWWDNHCFKGDGERFGLFDRAAARCVSPEIVEAFMRYCE